MASTRSRTLISRTSFAVAKLSYPVLVLLSLMVGSLAGLLFVPPIAQDQSYHDFADQRTLLGIPNFWNVVSNFPFLVIGATGLLEFHRHPATIALFVGIFL